MESLFMLLLMGVCVALVIVFAFLAVVNAWKMTFKETYYEKQIREYKQRKNRY